MLKLSEMTQGDAQHTMQVYAWIKEHLQEIIDLAENARRAGVTASEMQGQFHQEFTHLETTRFLPVTIAIFTDESALSLQEQWEPGVLLSQPNDTYTYVVADHFQTLDISEIASKFGIDGNERTWQLRDRMYIPDMPLD